MRGSVELALRIFEHRIFTLDGVGPPARPLVLEVKGDFCHQVRRILAHAGREDDYLEIGLGGLWQWNALDDPLLDSYSMAYGVASLINQLFGKSRDVLAASLRITGRSRQVSYHPQIARVMEPGSA